MHDLPNVAARRYSWKMSRLDRIVVNPEVVHGRPAIRGTRVRVADVLSLLAAGASEAEILDDYPYLTADDIRACLEYAAAQADHAIVLAS
ncbi:DUF433 domain-containing protein [Agreia sp. Leaf283]|uniref:DUF433 domain-containing protein n=1 Tax=Agreia sp. Leaf283 TaxID=1736321 RepID=UPI000AE572EA|nr:DUF433 domain-containing protein [Agreia sp. Leaf283]